MRATNRAKGRERVGRSIRSIAARPSSQRKVSANARRDFQRVFQSELAALDALEEERNAVLAERCRALAPDYEISSLEALPALALS